MAAYIISFITSLLFLSFAMKAKGKGGAFIFHILALLPPILLLTFRAEKCGTDTTHYISIFNSLSADSLGVLIASTRFEPLFSLLVYIVNCLHLKVEFFFFVCALLTVVPIYIGAFRLKNYLNPMLVMALYYLMFYQYSFNIVRQAIAMSLIFLAVVFLLQEKKKGSILLGVAALLFHTVGIVYFVVFFALLIVGKKFNKIVLFSILLSLLAIYLLPSVLMEKKEYFDDYLEAANEAHMQYSYLVEMFLNFIMVFFVWKNNKNVWRKFFLLISGICLFTILISEIAPYAFRIANCIDILLLLYIPMAIKSTRNKSVGLLYLSFAIVFWGFVFIYNNSGGSYPYILSSGLSLY